MKGTGIFYSRTGNKKLSGYFYEGINLDEIIMQDDYEVAPEESRLRLSDLDGKILLELSRMVYNNELTLGEPIRGIFSVGGEGVSIHEYGPSNLKGKEKIQSVISMFEEGNISRDDLIRAIGILDITNAISKEIIREEADPVIVGSGGSYGVAIGFLESKKGEIIKMHSQGRPAIYVTKKPGSEDMIIMKKSAGIIMTEGDPSSHPVILARSNNVPCVINLPEMIITDEEITYRGKTIKMGQEITIDGANGEIYDGKMKIREGNDLKLFSDLELIIGSVSPIKVYANADSAEELRLAQELGATGLGLCRTEHMMFGTREKLNNLRCVLFSQENQEKHLGNFVDYQREDFKEIFSQAEGQRVVTRLLDPPLNEFIPRGEEEIDSFLSYSGMVRKDYDLLEKKLLENASPLGIRGVRFGVTDPILYLAQVRSILEASGNDEANILLPFISFKNEFLNMSRLIKDYNHSNYQNSNLRIGAMIETPMSAFEVDFYAKNASFISYGLNDLTMTAFALERVGSDEMMRKYASKGIIQGNPFQSIIYKGMQDFISRSVNLARRSNEDVLIGVCSEQVIDPSTLNFFSTLPIDYVSTTGQSIPMVRHTLARSSLNG